MYSLSHGSSRSPARHSRSLMSRLRLALAIRRERHRLADLDDTILRDIGLSRSEAEAESRRPIWDVPGHWRR